MKANVPVRVDFTCLLPDGNWETYTVEAEVSGGYVSGYRVERTSCLPELPEDLPATWVASWEKACQAACEEAYAAWLTDASSGENCDPRYGTWDEVRGER
jgi:PhoPQ-activated pathogenicity-related protein